jgi:hypothetical protein
LPKTQMPTSKDKLKHALYELEKPMLKMYPPSDAWWDSFRLLEKFIGKHEVTKCSVCASQKST